jgi:hypothetical protein
MWRDPTFAHIPAPGLATHGERHYVERDRHVRPGEKNMSLKKIVVASAAGLGLSLATIGATPGTAPSAEAYAPGSFAGSSLMYYSTGTQCAQGVNATIRAGSSSRVYLRESWCRQGSWAGAPRGKTWGGYVGWAFR